jgi:site-specific DNA-methyltransferase (adenine-specific)
MTAYGRPEMVLDRSIQWAVLAGDCREVLPTLPDGSVQHVIMDPPYSKHVHSRSMRGAAMPDADMFSCRARRKRELGFEHLDPALGRFVAFHAARLAERWSMAFTDTESAHLWRAWFTRARLDYLRTLVWHKLGGAPQFTGDRPAAATEDIVLVHPRGRKRWNGGGKQGFYAVPIELDRLGRGKVDRFHTTQKPLELMLALIADFTDPGDIVLDPFMGSGTTGVACLRLGRRFLGIERDLAIAEKARDRLAAETLGLSRKELAAGQRSVLEIL